MGSIQIRGCCNPVSYTHLRVAAGVADAHNVRCLMFGMNMNNVAVTDGDRVEFEQRLGYNE